MIGLDIALTGLVFFILSTYVLDMLPDGTDPPLWAKAWLVVSFGGGAAAVISGLLFFAWQL